MNDRTTLWIVLIAVALALLVIFLEHDVSSVPYQSPERYKILRGLTQENVERITLLAHGDNTIQLKRESDRWFFKRPLPGTDGYAVEWEADREAVNRLVDVLVALREAAPAVVRRSGSPLDDYGLSNPKEEERIEVTLGTENGTMLTRKLYLGRAVPTDKDRIYVQLENDDRILIVENTLGQMMRLAREGGVAFRARNVFARSDLAETTKVALETGAYRAELEELADRIWRARWADKAGADSGRTFTARGSNDLVRKLAEAMQGLRVERFVADTAQTSDFARCGLLNPRANVTLSLEDTASGLAALFSGPQTADIRIGNEVPEAPDQVYAVAQRMPAIFTVKKSFLDELPGRGRDLAARRLVSFESSKVESLTLTNSHGKVEAGRKDYDWSLSEPLKIGGDYARLNGVVDAITTTDCDDVVWEGDKGLGDFGLSAPKAELSVSYEYESPGGSKRTRKERIRFGKVFEKEVPAEKAGKDDADDKKDSGDETNPAKDGDKKKPAVKKFVYAQCVGDVAIRVFPYEKFKNVFDPPLSFVKKRVLEFNAWDATTFSLDRPGGKYRFKKEGQDWVMVEPASIQADAGNVGGLVSSMSWLNAETIVAGDDSNLAAFGLDRPRYRLVTTIKVTEEEKKDEAEKKEDEAKGKDETKKPDSAAETGKADDGKKTDEKAPADEKAGSDAPAKPDEENRKPEKIVTYELLVSAKKDGDQETFYGKATGSSLIFTLEKSFVEKLEAELADTDIFPFEWNVREATAESQGRVVRLVRDAEGKDFQVSAAREGELKKAEAEPARTFFTRLGGTKVQGHYLTYDAKDLKPYGFESDRFAVISSRDKDGKSATLEVGAKADAAKHGEGLRYARRAGTTAVFLVKQEDLDALLKPAGSYLPEAERKKAEAAEMGPPAGPGAGEEKKDGAPAPAKGAEEPKEKPSSAPPAEKKTGAEGAGPDKTPEKSAGTKTEAK